MPPPRVDRRLAWGLAAALLATACSSVPYTERRQYNVIPNGVMSGLGETTYVTSLADHQIIESGESVDVLHRVSRNLARSVHPDGSFAWEYELLSSEQVNAWALPGGFIAFYSGILPALRNEAGMAFVMGHEIGHATASHSAERLSQQLTIIGGLQVLEVYLSRRSALSGQQRHLVMAALGLGAEVGVLLPYSRLHEHEADILGLMYMSGAGYPPEESLAVWDRMAVMAESRSPMFLSTHPAPDDRQDVLNEWMPRARKRYERNRLDYDTTVPLWPGTDDGTSAAD